VKELKHFDDALANVVQVFKTTAVGFVAQFTAMDK
jgi:hypothetical protein